MNRLSLRQPLPSIEMQTPWFISKPVKAAPANWLPRSVLKISGVPYLVIASSTASVQNSVSIEIDSRQASTRRLY